VIEYLIGNIITYYSNYYVRLLNGEIMKKFVYPAVIYYDEDALVYVMHIEDLGIVVEGDTVEEAHKRAGQFMDIYLETAFKEELDIPEATEFDKMVSAHPKEMVVLIESTLNDKNKAIKVDK